MSVNLVMRPMAIVFFGLQLVVWGALSPLSAQAQGVPDEQRIQTLVYDENEVFTIVNHFGYQSNIEFGPKERIKTISLGDQSLFAVIPSERRLFIRALMRNQKTNMTVITNKRVYQFDLSSAERAKMIYVARFFYPQPFVNELPVGTASAEMPGMGAQMPLPMDASYDEPSEPVQAAPVGPVSSAPAQEMGYLTLDSSPYSQQMGGQTETTVNYAYTLTGPETIAPYRIYDNGRQTYFEFTRDVPQVFVVDEAGMEVAANIRQDGRTIIVPTTAKRFSLRQGGEVVCVFNELMGP